MIEILEIPEMPEDLKAKLKEIGKKLDAKVAQMDARKDFKLAVGIAMGKAIEEDKLDTFYVVEDLLTLAAITLNCYHNPVDGVDPRKTFGKIAKICYDKALDVAKRVDAKGE